MRGRGAIVSNSTGGAKGRPTPPFSTPERPRLEKQCLPRLSESWRIQPKLRAEEEAWAAEEAVMEAEATDAAWAGFCSGDDDGGGGGGGGGGGEGGGGKTKQVLQRQKRRS